MSLYSNIKKNLKESVKYKDLNDDAKIELSERGRWTCYYCDECGSCFNELDSKNVDLESYYGVGSDFPDTHYGTFYYCPNCGAESPQEVTLYFEDLLEEYVNDKANEENIIKEFKKYYPEIDITNMTNEEIFDKYIDEIYEMVNDLGLY